MWRLIVSFSKRSRIYIFVAVAISLYFFISGKRNEYSGIISVSQCKIPTLDVHAREIMQFIKPSKPIVCSGMDYVEINRSLAFIPKEAGENVKCKFADIIRKDDYKNVLKTDSYMLEEYELRESDFILAKCSKNGFLTKNVLAGIRINERILDRTGWDKVPKDGLKLNVLMFGFDSLSRLMFERKLPKSLDYLKNTLGTIELEGYNIVGDGTPQALIPILTGKTERELPETRKRFENNATFVNVYPFIWKDFEKNGYVTGYGEDMPEVGTFHYRLMGFKKAPTIHYLRPFLIEARLMEDKNQPLCIGAKPAHKVMMKYVLDFYRVYRDKPKFFFLFYSRTSHSSVNGVGSLDEDFLEWLKTVHGEGHLENTLLIVMSDHGPRFSEVRNTLQGKLEERLPMFSFAFPKWFQSAHPLVIQNLRHNSKVLTTPFDIHPTLMDVIKYDGVEHGDLKDRSISLFKRIPSSRTCVEAQIEPHWCTCLVWNRVNVTNEVVQSAARFVTKEINALSEELRNKCRELFLSKVLESSELLPRQDLVTFVKTYDADGFLPFKTQGKSTVTQKVYQLKLLLHPGDALYEVSVTYYAKEKKYFLDPSNISRISKYNPYIGCLSDTELHLRKFCYCRN